jgi:hypothetical protein
MKLTNYETQLLKELKQVFTDYENSNNLWERIKYRYLFDSIDINAKAKTDLVSRTFYKTFIKPKNMEQWSIEHLDYVINY